MHFVRAIFLAGALCSAAVFSYRTNDKDELTVLEEFLYSEHGYSSVLDERVKNVDAPPYRTHFPEAVVARERDPDDPSTEYDTHAVLRRVVYEYSTVGSFVRWAVGVVHKAYACHTTKHLLAMAQRVANMFAKNDDPDAIFAELRTLRDGVAVFIDTLASMPAKRDDTLFFATYWEYISLMQHEVSGRVRYANYPRDAGDSLKVLDAAYVQYLSKNCTGSVRPFSGHELKKLLDSYRKKPGTLPKSLWNQAFYHTKTPPTEEELNELSEPITNPPPVIDQQPTLVQQ